VKVVQQYSRAVGLACRMEHLHQAVGTIEQLPFDEHTVLAKVYFGHTKDWFVYDDRHVNRRECPTLGTPGLASFYFKLLG
jgi:hypothetical protein